MSDAHRVGLRIDAAHPALAGHFPGRPLVPGVVLLERVAAACKAWRGQRIGRLDAKFLQPLLPGEEAEIQLHEEGSSIAFRVARADGATLARGKLVPAADVAPA